MNRSTADAILYPFLENQLSMPATGASVLYLNARDADALAPMARNGTWDMVQDFRPWTDQLASLEGSPNENTKQAYDTAMVLCTRQTDETRGLLARAALALKQGGWLVAAAANDEGGKRLAGLCDALGLRVESAAKYHARIVWGQKDNMAFADQTARDWVDTAALKICDATGFVSCPGLFSWDRIDPGSALLATHLPKELKGHGGDFGCGYGFLAKTVLETHSRIKKLFCYDADRRAVKACRANLAADARVACDWVDLTRGAPAANLDWIVMNPPFHEGSVTRADIGPAFIKTAAEALHRGGALYMVANAQLGYEAALGNHFSDISRLFEGKGYKIYKALKKD